MVYSFAPIILNKLHAMLFAANVCEFILLPRISSLGQRKQFMIVNIPIWDATINRICVNDESNTKHLQFHAMLVAAYVHEFILLSRISSLGKRKQFYDSKNSQFEMQLSVKFV